MAEILQIETLSSYLQHKRGCAALTRRDYCRPHGGDGSINGCPTCQNISAVPACTCGLAEVLARESSLREQIQKMTRYRRANAMGMEKHSRGQYLYIADVLALVGDDHG